MSHPAAWLQAAVNLLRDIPHAPASSPDFAIATASGIHDRPNVGVDLPGVDVATSTMAGAVIATATAAAAATATAVASPVEDGGSDDRGECRLLGSFALLVQLCLGALALLALVYKRWRERPQRPAKIWFFDASKQVFGSVLVHMANVFMSMLTSGRFSVTLEPAAAPPASRLLRRDDYVPNPCSFYLLNLAIDTTIGIPILIVLLRIFTGLVSYTPLGKPPESIQSGNYGRPPNAWWWLKQSIIYFCGLFGMKICVLIVFLMLPWISRVGDWALSWTEGNEKVQIVFVMMLFPLIMNALQYYIIDSFIKKAAPKSGDESDSDAAGSYDRISESGSDDDVRSLGSVDEIDPKPNKGKGNDRLQEEEYDPSVDGDNSTVVGSSVSTHKTIKMPSELYPNE